MKKSSFLALALAPMILGVPMAATAQSVSTDPVGFVKLNADAGGLSSLGTSMVNPASAAGIVEAVNGNTLTLNTDLTGLDLSAPHYLEVRVDPAVGAPFSGDRFDIASVSGNDVTLSVGASTNSTLDVVPAQLAGTSVVVRRHVTLSQLNDWDTESAIVGHPFQSLADQVLFFDGAGYITGHYDGTNWIVQGANANNRVIAPGAGIFYRRAGGTPLELVSLGEVRTNEFRQPIEQGLNFVGTGFPADTTPAERGFSTTHGFTAHPFASLADQILVWGGSGFVTYHLTEGSTWQNSQSQVLTTFDPTSSVFLLSRNGNEDFVSPKPF